MVRHCQWWHTKYKWRYGRSYVCCARAGRRRCIVRLDQSCFCRVLIKRWDKSDLLCCFSALDSVRVVGATFWCSTVELWARLGPSRSRTHNLPREKRLYALTVRVQNRCGLVFYCFCISRGSGVRSEHSYHLSYGDQGLRQDLNLRPVRYVCKLSLSDYRSSDFNLADTGERCQ